MNHMTVPSQDLNATVLKDEERTRCEVWTRVMGYHRPVTSFNKGKKSEHRERRFFVESRCRME
ncbi:MAG TPA: anaerobic ribonucleoside-triphosphate reductase [Thiobacillus sp.]